MENSKIILIKDGKFRVNPNLFRELLKLLYPSYENPELFLNESLNRCDTLFLLRDELDQLSAFFLVSWESIYLNGSDRMTCYLGLSATRQDLKNTAEVGKLYDALRDEAIKAQQEVQSRIILWFTTATPSAWNAANTRFTDLQPRINGGYTKEGESIATEIRSLLKINLDTEKGHPFVLKKFARNTLYSSEERLRIRNICNKHKFRLFEELQIDERVGDRILCICFVS